MERWENVVGTFGVYEVSNLGRVKSFAVSPDGRILKPIISKGKYKRTTVTLCNQKQHTVGRLVLTAFVGPCPSGMECAHKNGDPTDNRLSNLRWSTPAENEQDKARCGLTHNTACRLTADDVRDIRKRAVKGKRGRKRKDGVDQKGNYKSLAKKYGVNVTTIWQIVNRVTWTNV